MMESTNDQTRIKIYIVLCYSIHDNKQVHVHLWLLVFGLENILLDLN